MYYSCSQWRHVWGEKGRPNFNVFSQIKKWAGKITILLAQFFSLGQMD